MHCFDGDSTYLTFTVENELFRLLGIDAPEIRGLNLQYLEKSGFLNRLDRNLREYLEPKLTNDWIQVQKEFGLKAREFLESILEEELVLSFEKEVFDRYDRALVYLSSRDHSYNLRLIQEGLAIPYFIYPNAVTPTENEEWNYDTIHKFREAALEAKKHNLGVWKYMDHILLPMELRFLTRRELPQKYCADLENHILYSPQHYFKVSIENRLFFYPKDVLAALEEEFKPTSDCEGWLHKIWGILKGRR